MSSRTKQDFAKAGMPVILILAALTSASPVKAEALAECPSLKGQTLAIANVFVGGPQKSMGLLPSNYTDSPNIPKEGYIWKLTPETNSNLPPADRHYGLECRYVRADFPDLTKVKTSDYTESKLISVPDTAKLCTKTFNPIKMSCK